MTDQANEGLLSPLLRRRRLKAVEPYLRGRILDVGCGSGALAQWVPCGLYLGVEQDDISRTNARQLYPGHQFVKSLDQVPNEFDTVVSLAVIEHVPDVSAFLASLASKLAPDKAGCLVCTTPHPSFERIYDFGASLGLFSQHAHQEHEDLLDHSSLKSAGQQAGLELVAYRRFLFGANQLAMYRRGMKTS